MIPEQLSAPSVRFPALDLGMDKKVFGPWLDKWSREPLTLAWTDLALDLIVQVADHPSAEQKAIAERWNLWQGTVTPAGVWNLIAKDLAREEHLNDAETARLFAAPNVAMLDAFIACWHAKCTWWTERPVTVIREKLDPAFLPYLLTSPFPSYVSGHATVSGAAAEVLAAFFPPETDVASDSGRGGSTLPALRRHSFRD